MSAREHSSSGAVMEHEQAIRSHAAERYVLGELPDDIRDAYEEHYFSCAECAAEVIAASELAEAMRRGHAAPVEEGVQQPAPRPQRQRWNWLWSPALAYAAAIALAAVVTYQNGIVIPRMKREVAQLGRPLALASFNLTTLGSRAVPELVIQPPSRQPFVLLVSIPPDPPARRYEVVVLTAGGAERLRVPVTAEQARDTVQVLVPPGTLSPGKYRLVTEAFSTSGLRAEVESNAFTVQ